MKMEMMMTILLDDDIYFIVPPVLYHRLSACFAARYKKIKN